MANYNDENYNPEFTDKFYIKKFMEIQQSNVILWRKLDNLKSDNMLNKLIREKFGDGFFDGLDDMVR